MKNPKKKCVICGEEFEIYDMRNPQKHCGKLMCKRNYEYISRRENATQSSGIGSVPTPDQVKKI